MTWADWWRERLRGRAFRRLRRRHGTAPEGLAPGLWVGGGEEGREAAAEGPTMPADELGSKLRKISAAYREARRERPPRRRRRR